MGRDKALNRAMDCCESRPKRISLSMSTNSWGVQHMSSATDILPTLILLPEDFGEIEGAFDSLAPERSFKGKFDLASTLCDWGELEKIASDHNLVIIVVRFSKDQL
jgi:hypothetical protein